MLQDKKKKLYQIKKNHINFFVLENKYPEIRKKHFTWDQPQRAAMNKELCYQHSL